MILKINGNPLAATIAEPDPKQEYDGFMDWVNNGPIGQWSDAFIEWETEVIFKPATKATGDGIMAVVDLLNANSAGIIAFAIVLCGFGMMGAPMWGDRAGKWFGRAMFVLWVGIIWRVII
jgi:hypothetical protein